jgi:hypothetical protein
MEGFAKRLDKAISSIGLELAPMAFDIATVPWEYPSQLDEFLEDFTGEPLA